MPLQNRVNPYGNIEAVSARGTLMGNRGLLHNKRREVTRPWQKGKPWITCRLEFKGSRRTLMSPGRYTELFFLDEATALAAGHRPCAECRREDFNHFKQLWLEANPDRVPPGSKSIKPIDQAIFDDCFPNGENRSHYTAESADLPDGVMVAIDGTPWLLWNGSALRWSFEGYTERVPRPTGSLSVITPRSTVNAIAAGYIPAVHDSAQQF